jgi:hypothetical protein
LYGSPPEPDTCSTHGIDGAAAAVTTGGETVSAATGSVTTGEETNAALLVLCEEVDCVAGTDCDPVVV